MSETTDDLVFVVHDEPVVVELEALGNLDRPPEKRMRAHLVPASFADWRRAMALAAQSGTKDSGGRFDDTVFQRELFIRQVAKIENIPIKRGDEVAEATAADLFDARSSALSVIAGEIFQHLRRLETVDTKN